MPTLASLLSLHLPCPSACALMGAQLGCFCTGPAWPGPATAVGLHHDNILQLQHDAHRLSQTWARLSLLAAYLTTLGVIPLLSHSLTHFHRDSCSRPRSH